MTDHRTDPIHTNTLRGDWIVLSEPDCTSDGVQEKRCLECQEVINNQVLPALGHVEVIDEAVAPTCTEDGLTQGKHCERCDAVLEEQNTVFLLCHSLKLPAPSDTEPCMPGTVHG